MIIHIDKDTRQKHLLEKLAYHAGGDGVIRISVNSLPIYLSTKIAFNIFSYRLRNYPREIVWVSLDDNIIEILELSELKIDKNFYLVNRYSEVKNNIDNDANALTSSNNDEKKQVKDGLKLVLSNDNIDNSTSFDEIETVVEEIDSIKNFQNLDSWLERIEATKIALDNLKPDEAKEVFGFSDFISGISFSSNKDQNKSYNKPRSFSYLSTIFAGVVVIIVFLVSFPTNVFTLEVVPQEIESNINLSLPIDSFSKKTLKIDKQATKPSSGADKDITERATGSVKIINNSFQDLSLDTNNIYFEKGPNKYYFFGDSTVSNDINIPANNEETGDIFELRIQAEDSGSSYSIDSNQRLEIYNNLGQTVCDNCFAITTTNVQGQVVSGGKVVTQSDQVLLRSTIEGLLAQARLDEIDNLKQEDIIIDPTWYKNLDSVFVYDHKLGDTAKDVSLQVEVTTSIYYLPKSTLQEILNSENNEIDKIKSIELKSSGGSFIDDADIDLSLLYSYTKDDGIDKKEITKKLSSQDHTKIQIEYPNIRRVQKKQLGFDIPFVNPRVDINIVESE